MHLEISSLSGEGGLEFRNLTYKRYRHLLKYEEANRAYFFSIGARIDGTPTGLALSEFMPGSIGELRSLYVLPEYRRQGIAAALLNASEKEALKHGCKTFGVLYQENYNGDIMTRLTDSGRYSEPEFKALEGRSVNRGKLLNAPFLKKSLLPPSCEIFLWKDLTEPERAQILEKQERENWYPAILSPFTKEHEIEYLNSIGLRYKGEVAGWVITHRISKSIIRYTTSFVREDLQQYGFTAPLLIEAIKIHMNSPASYEATDASFIIPSQFEPMIAFARKRMLPYLEEYGNVYYRTKPLK